MSQATKPVRQTTRLRDFDYAQPGAYFITICAHQRENQFGEIVDGVVRLNLVGEMISACWQEIPRHFPQTTIDQFVVMPNHFHGIIFIDDTRERATHGSPLQLQPTFPVGASHGSPGSTAPKPATLGIIIAQFKSSVTRQLKRIGNHPGTPIWQRNYHDRVIRDEDDLRAIREYVVNNPLRWELDKNYPGNF